jgi:hypothetical protein
MQSVAVRKIMLKCPPLGEEQFTNGTFETGDLTGWIVDGRHIEGPFAPWLGTRNEPEQSSEWKLHGDYSMKVVVPENGQAGVFNAYTDFDMNPMFIAVFGFHPVSGNFSGTSSPIIHIRPASSVTRNVAGFAVKKVGATDYFFFQWSDYLGEYEENTGVVVEAGNVYFLQVGCKWSGRNVANGFAKGWINGGLVANKTGIKHYTTGFDFIAGQDVGVWLRGGARDVTAYFDDCVMHNDEIVTNPFADGGPYLFMSGFETIDRGPAWEASSNTPIGHSPSEGAKLAFIHACVTDPELWGCPHIEGTLKQDFPTPIPYECFRGTSIFEIQTLWDDDVGCPPEPPDIWKIEVLYTDDTSTVLDISGDPRATWIIHDLKAIIEERKTVKGIRITGKMRNCGYLVGRQGQEGAVDACTLKI